MSKRKVNDSLLRFCATCHEEADLKLRPAPNVYCRNRACEQYGKRQMGGPDPGAICEEATPEFKAEMNKQHKVDDELDLSFLDKGEPTPEEVEMKALDKNGLEQRIALHKSIIEKLEAESSAMINRATVLKDKLRATERERDIRTIDAMRAKIDITKPARPTLTKLLSMLRKYGQLFDKHPVCNVKYDPEAVTCERRRGCYRENVEIMSDGKVFRDGILACNLVTDHPREWKL